MKSSRRYGVYLFGWVFKAGADNFNAAQGFNGTNTAATVQVHPNGRFLYASNRGADDIAVYSIDPQAGTLTLVESIPSQGKRQATSPSIPAAHGLSRLTSLPTRLSCSESIRRPGD